MPKKFCGQNRGAFFKTAPTLGNEAIRFRAHSIGETVRRSIFLGFLGAHLSFLGAHIGFFQYKKLKFECPFDLDSR